MIFAERVKLFIIDDNQNFEESLKSYFNEMPEAEIIRCETDAAKIKKAIISNNPDIILIDIENLGLVDVSVFEELVRVNTLTFKVILFSNNKLIHLFQTRKLKCGNELLDTDELKISIRNYIQDKKMLNFAGKPDLKTDIPVNNKFIAFQTLIGLRFINKKNVVYFEYSKDEKSGRSQWEAYLDNAEVIRLKLNTTSKDIMKHFENHDFIQISQSNIINLNFFSSVELKSRKCLMQYPYEGKGMVISRAYFNEIKSKFEID
jgi:DNA-binding LytR/AlgR family response regulator